MRRLTEIGILWCLIGINYSHLYSIENLPVYALASLGICIFLEIMIMTGSRSIWQVVTLLLYLCLGIWDNQFWIFMPLIIYSGFSSLGMSSLILSILQLLTGEWMSVLFSVLAAYLSYQSTQFKHYTRQNMALSDELKEHMISLQKYNDRLLENEYKNKEIARLEERNNIARQLHDYLGHTISSSILQIEALKLTEQDEGKKERLGLLQDTLSKGMTDIRKQLHGMYDTSFSLQRELGELSASTPKIQMDIKYQIKSNLSFERKRDIYNIIREALTNTLKHSDADCFHIFLKEQGHNQVLLIYDNGSQEVKTINRNMGLTGMEEIARKYGGKINYYFKKGFHIHIVLPGAEGEEHADR